LSEILINPAIIARETSFSEPLVGLAHDDPNERDRLQSKSQLGR